MNNYKIINLQYPSQNNDVCNKLYVDNQFQNINPGIFTKFNVNNKGLITQTFDKINIDDINITGFGDNTKFLRGDGKWETTGSIITVPDNNNLVLYGDNTWNYPLNFNNTKITSNIINNIEKYINFKSDTIINNSNFIFNYSLYNQNDITSYGYIDDSSFAITSNNSNIFKVLNISGNPILTITQTGYFGPPSSKLLKTNLKNKSNNKKKYLKRILELPIYSYTYNENVCDEIHSLNEI
jgi:hypothetical protein